MTDKPKEQRPAQPKSEPKSEPKSKSKRVSEDEVLLASLRAHGQLVESEDPDVALGPGQTHVLVKKPGQPGGTLVEKRKSLFKR